MTKRNQADHIEARYFYESGASVDAVMSRFNWSRGQAYDRLARLGTQMRRSGVPFGHKSNPVSVAKRAAAARRPLSVRFDRHHTPEPNSGCWLWFGSTDTRGYGQMRVDGRIRIATHIALELVGRQVPKGMQACHHCDSPACVNPEHLFIGTMKDNVADMIRKGRHDHSGLALGRGRHG